MKPMTLDRIVASSALWLTITLGLVSVATTAVFVSPAARNRLGISGFLDRNYAVGRLIDVPVRIYSQAAVTVIIFARGSCPACEQAKPTFRELSQAAQRCA